MPLPRVVPSDEKRTSARVSLSGAVVEDDWGLDVSDASTVTATDHHMDTPVTALHSVGVIDMSGEISDVKLCATALDRVLKRPGCGIEDGHDDGSVPVNHFNAIPPLVMKYGGHRKPSTKTITSVGQPKPTTKSSMSIMSCHSVSVRMVSLVL